MDVASVGEVGVPVPVEDEDEDGMTELDATVDDTGADEDEGRFAQLASDRILSRRLPVRPFVSCVSVQTTCLAS